MKIQIKDIFKMIFSDYKVSIRKLFDRRVSRLITSSSLWEHECTSSFSCRLLDTHIFRLLFFADGTTAVISLLPMIWISAMPYRNAITIIERTHWVGYICDGPDGSLVVGPIHP
jgi:hypothetical protein